MNLLKRFYQKFEILCLTFFVGGIIFPFYVVINYFSVGREHTILSCFIDQAIPFIPAWEYVYAFVYFAAFTPLTIIRSASYFRRIAFMYASVMIVGEIIFLLFPVMMIRVIPSGEGFVNWGINLNNYLDPPFNCFPSMHVGNAFCASFAIYNVHRFLGIISVVGAILIGLSTLFVKQHYVLDVMAGFLLSYVFYILWIKSYNLTGIPRQKVMRNPYWFLVGPALYLLAVFILFMLFKSGITIPKPPWEIPQNVIYQ
ncbi:phosphatase PAP2 family protein [candidate division CSSED10-310 bacterium]|uniref:Phosphatase PAP2 family protein n=1 Tax=candidate division CSSED10-310 bacterium TaxID=2855610 RepID=A0ABV6YTV0_UNCC1